VEQPNQSPARVITFMVILSFICATILSVLASALKEPQDVAKELDRSQQMLIAARIFNPNGYFQLLQDNDTYVPAKVEQNGVLVPGTVEDHPTQEQVLAVYKQRFQPILINDKGDVVTFSEANINEAEYTAEHRKTGYATLPLKLAYKILPNPTGDAAKDAQPIGYVFPVSGFGLWDAIYGYIAIKTDGDTVIGISWYDHKETPGLGAVIAEPGWQSNFPDKKLFVADSTGQTDFKTAPIGITVVRGLVNEVYGTNPRARSAVDGMPGATLTGTGVTKAYKDSLSPYRPFLTKLHNEQSQQNSTR
jgi:Na+-transporting NADH:ubiquinone oxidoreductase subunit C